MGLLDDYPENSFSQNIGYKRINRNGVKSVMGDYVPTPPLAQKMGDALLRYVPAQDSDPLAYKPEQDALVPPMISPYDLIGTGIPTKLAGLLAKGASAYGGGLLAAAGMMQPTRMLRLANGKNVQVRGMRELFDRTGLEARPEISFWRDGHGRATFDNWYGGTLNRDDFLRVRGGTSDEYQKLIQLQNDVVNEKRAGLIQNSVDNHLASLDAPRDIPEWARNMTSQQNTSAAGASWWDAALAEPSINSFASAIRKNQQAFKLPLNTDSKNAQEVAAHFSQGSKAPITAQWDGGKLSFFGGDGQLDILKANTGKPIIRSLDANSQGNEAGMGKELYQTAYNWITNNGKRAYPDSGITKINDLRKNGNVLAAQVRNGDLPVAVMNTNRLDGPQRIPALWQAEAEEASSRLPEIGAIKFDGDTFSMGGVPVDNKKIASLISGIDPKFSRGVGPMTAKRKAVLDWLKSASPDEAKRAADAWKGGALFPAGLLWNNQEGDGK